MDKEPVSKICEDNELQPSLFYHWFRQAVGNLAAALGPPAPNEASKREKELVAKNWELELKLMKKDNVIAEISAEYVQLKKTAWGALTGRWVPHDTRDAVVDFVRTWSDKTEIAAARFIEWIGVSRGKFFAWRKRYGKANEHNGLVPRDHWLLDEEKRAIINFHDRFPLEGYRRLTFMMIDQEDVAASPASVYRVLAGAGLLDRWNKKPSKKGTGFVQPLRAHEHWHIDSAYLTPADFLTGRGPAIWAERDRKLELARETRRVRRAEFHHQEAAS